MSLAFTVSKCFILRSGVTSSDGLLFFKQTTSHPTTVAVLIKRPPKIVITTLIPQTARITMSNYRILVMQADFSKTIYIHWSTIFSN